MTLPHHRTHEGHDGGHYRNARQKKRRLQPGKKHIQACREGLGTPFFPVAHVPFQIFDILLQGGTHVPDQLYLGPHAQRTHGPTADEKIRNTKTQYALRKP